MMSHLLKDSNNPKTEALLFPIINKRIAHETEHWVLRLTTILRYKYKRSYYLVECSKASVINGPTDYQNINLMLEEFVKEVYYYQQLLPAKPVPPGVFKDNCQITEHDRLRIILAKQLTLKHVKY